MHSVQSLIKQADFLVIAQARANRSLDVEIDPKDERSVATVLLAILCIQHGCAPENLLRIAPDSELMAVQTVIIRNSEDSHF